MAKLLVVVGATGNQGRGTIEYFQKHVPTYRLRGTTRNSSSETAKKLQSSGVEIVEANLDDIESLKRAFVGANAIWAYTAFGEILATMMPKVFSGELSAPVGQHAAPIEFQQGKNVADAAAEVPELERLVWSTLTDVKKWSQGKYTQGFHLDPKAHVFDYMRSLPPLQGKASAVNMGMFADNIITYGFGMEKVDDGSFVWKLNLSPDKPLPFVDVHSDTGAFVKALLDAPAGTVLEGVSEWLNPDQYLKLLCDHLDVRAKFQELSVEEMAGNDPTGWGHEMAETLAFCNEYGFTGGDKEVISPDELEKRGFKVPRTQIVNIITRSDWSSMLKMEPNAG